MLVRDVMTNPAVVISPDTTLEDAYRVMHEKQIRHLLVVEQTRLLGVITDRDLRLATSTLTLSLTFPARASRTSCAAMR
jgi:acetoin utilization protein AcuB